MQSRSMGVSTPLEQRGSPGPLPANGARVSIEAGGAERDPGGAQRDLLAS